MNIGIEYHSKLVYEAASNYGHPVWPSPRLLQVKIYPCTVDVLIPAQNSEFDGNSILFREDTYNTSSRVRRGRLYKAGESVQSEWQVYPHPQNPMEIQEAAQQKGTLQKRVYCFRSFRLHQYLKDSKIEEPILVLGVGSGYSIWALVDIETSATGDELVTLKARKNIGALPKLNRELVLAEGGKNALSFIQKLEDEIGRAGPEPIVNAAREAATAILSAYLQHRKQIAAAKDIADLAEKAGEMKLEIVANSARILGRYHARTKSAEQERNSIRPITEQDAEYSIQAVGTIICELGWGSY